MSAAAGAVILAGAMTLAAAGDAQATVGVFNCPTVIELNLSLGLVNGYGCTGTLGDATAGTINDTGRHRSYWCTSLRILNPELHAVGGGGCRRQ
ncbi:hypothetical protein [Actinophytocola sp.]|uniref:hypothetical protein n=1 Tax=Actinophytocola sp. TaxID=1872138 RepID=UPI002D809968|nr:hypothetical protein [Actinophytocola sp.]HET9138672.1 hypothetical protein [Actinophytocola sp.]